ncbi:MAG: hypothetical protein E7485_09500 [Ruminococcaceae bacterium]|nr:hypothetical protein [Oscillospiraceae bacterium]
MKRFLPLLAAFCLIFTACNKPEEESSSLPTEIIVSSGSDVQTEEAQPFPVVIRGTEIKTEAKTAVSLSPAVTDILVEVGFSNRLIAKSNYCDFPDLDIKTVGSSENPDIEAIIGLKPDVVFTLSALSERDVYALSEAGCAVIMLDPPNTIEEYSSLYSDIASAFGGREAAETFVVAAAGKLEKAAERIQLESFIYVTDKLTAAGSNTFDSAVLSLCGENLCTSEGYTPLDALGDISPKYIIAADTLTKSDIKDNDILSDYIDDGAEILFVSSFAFERPTARTADVFTQIEEQLGLTPEAE